MQKLKSGLLRINRMVTLLDSSHKRYFATGETVADAEKALQAQVDADNNRIRYGTALDNGEVKLFEAIETMLANQSSVTIDNNNRPKRANTTDRDRYAYTGQIKPFKKLNKLIKDIYPADMYAWRDWVNQCKNKNTGKPLSADTKNRALTLISQVLARYYERTAQISPASVLHYWRRPTPKKAALDEAEIHTLFDFCAANPSDNADIMMLIVLIYCRPGEALALKVKDYNADTHMLHINRTIVSHCVLSDDDRAKTDASIRDIAVPQMAHDILMRYISGKKKDDLLFPAPKKGKNYPKDESNFNHFVRRSLHRCGIDKDLHAHNLRTTGISYAQYKGANVYGVSANAGHRDINTTLHIYTAVYNRQKTDATDVMDKAFGNPPHAD